MADKLHANKPAKDLNTSVNAKPTDGLSHAGTRGKQALVLGLQRTVGNRAVQRLLMTGYDFWEEAGAPRQDVELPIFGFTIKEHSKQYMKIYELINDYHKLLSRLIIKPTKNARAEDAKTLLTALDELKHACTYYLLDHMDRFSKAKKAESKLKVGKSLSESNDRELKRNRTITKLKDVQIKADREALEAFAKLNDPQVKNHVGATWRQAVFAGTTSQHDLNQQALNDEVKVFDGITFGAPTLGLGFGGAPQPNFAGGGGAAPQGYYANAVIHAPVGQPVQTQANQLPNPDHLYTLGGKINGFVPPNLSFSVKNTPATAVVDPAQILANELFIGNGDPHVNEIAQGSIGDCYFLAALTQIVAKDPARIQQMMQVSGGNVSVDLFYKEDKTGFWKPRRITLPQTVMMSQQGYVKGAGYKLDSAPARHDWWTVTKTLPSTRTTLYALEVVRRDYVRAALWMPYLEKAYLRFAQEHGQYGTGAMSSDKDKSGGEVVNEGGYSRLVYPLFYGAYASEDQQSVEYRDEPLPDLLARNRPLIIRLLQANDPNLKDADNIEQQVNLTASADRQEHVARALTVLESMQKDGASVEFLKKKLGANYQAFTVQLVTLVEELGKAKTLNLEKAETAQPLAKAAKDTLGRGALWYDDLHSIDAERTAQVSRFVEMVANLINIGTDHSTGQRNIYSRHAYTVQSIVFKGSSDNLLNGLMHQNLDEEEFKKIDLNKSTVQLRNPHATNTPNIDDTGDVGPGGGVFDLSLEQFIRNFGRIDIGIVKGVSNGG
ncbi:MAG: hypothetical protein IAE80_28235 [Anaerolinea sp.]|nr:hypothetical protein [Anaerolinea sp.]